MHTQEKIRTIINESRTLIEKHFDELNTKLSGVVIYSKSSDEIETLVKELNALGEHLGESSDSIVFQIEFDGRNVLVTVSKNVTENEVIGEGVYSVDSLENLGGEFDEKVVNGVVTKQFAPQDSSVLLTFVEKTKELDANNFESGTSGGDDKNEGNEMLLENEKNARLQLMADFQNFRKRVEEERALFGAMANMSLIQDLFEVFDDLNLALNDGELDLKNAVESMRSAQQKIQTASEKAGVVRIETKVGDEFDKEFMEAISMIDAGAEMKGKVIAVISSAMKFKDRDGVIKAAKVVVGK